ncbi:MAG: Fe-S cluster assembly ATPase SufC [Saprospirales bacterium]|nr:Fe-S cluster assembly ATPase SufC [Saprospirales bacterium]
MLEIKNLHANVVSKPILKGLNLNIAPGEVHAIMGPNGTGKSTLASTLAGRNGYEVTKGDIVFEGEDLLDMEPDERARAGVFLAFQYPVEIPGVTTINFMKSAINARRKAEGEAAIKASEFMAEMKKNLELVEINQEFMKRSVNVGFSGGEKKRNEIFQMAMLNPKLCILDETDSGLDIDALRVVSEGVNAMRSKERSFLIITHYQRLLDYIQPDFVHVMYNGKIVKSGDKSLAKKLEDKGYDWIKEANA